MTYFEDKVVDTLEALRDALRDQFRARDWALPCVLELMPGAQVAINYALECDDGMAWVRMVGIGPPEDAGAPTCTTVLTMTVEMGIVRGATWGDNGEPPPAEDQRSMTLQQVADMAAMLQSLETVTLPEDEGFASPTYEPYGPEGNAVGGTWTFTVRLI